MSQNEEGSETEWIYALVPCTDYPKEREREREREREIERETNRKTPSQQSTKNKEKIG